MKKVTVVAAILALAAATAFAYPGGRYAGQGAPCGGPGYGAGGAGFEAPCGGPGYGRGAGFGGPVGQNGEAVAPIDDAGAKAKVQEYLDANLKGFEIADATKFDRPMGSVYRFAVKDSNGNQFLLMVNPFGYVRGPIPVQSVK